MQRTVLPLKIYEYATAPLAPEQRALILPKGGSFTDKQPYIFTARYDGSGRLIVAFPEFFPACNSEKRLYSEASRRLVTHFPILKDVSIQFLWRGTAWLNPSLLPKVYDLLDGAFAIQACNGRGLATNTVLGKEMATLLIERNEEELSIQLEAPAKIRGHRLLKMAPSVLMGLAYLNNRVLGVKVRGIKG
jgi:glycine/D-amino acid oxidase-like deaminating enzyme